MSILHTSATELLAQFAAKKLTSVEVTTACLNEIERIDGKVGAFLRVDREGALKKAKEVDEKRAAGKPVGALAGVPVGVKDVLSEKGQINSCGSKMLEKFVAPYDSTVVAKLKAADAILIGRLNMDEFAMGGSTENSAYQVTRNPWDLKCIPGGSSGGSAACLAASMVPLSIGTDTGGSIRQPASLCGVTGLKPTYGRVSRYGLVAFASSLDQVGPMACTVADAALLLEVISGHDPLDSTSAPVPVPKFSATVNQPLSGLRLGVVKEHFGPGLDPEVAAAAQAAIKEYEKLGAKVKEVSFPHSKYGIAVYYIIAPCEASSNLARYDGVHYGYRSDEKKFLAELQAEAAAGQGKVESPLVRLYRKSRAEGFGPEVKRRIMLGTYALSAGYYDAYYVKALKVRRLIRRDYDDAFKDVDLIVGPVAPTPAYPIGAKTDDPLAMYLGDLYTVSTNLAGLGGISIPCGFSKAGLPIGLQLQAPALEEERLLRAAQMYQQATDWHTKRPKVA